MFFTKPNSFLVSQLSMEMVKKISAEVPAQNGVGEIQMGNTLRFHLPYVGANAILNPHSLVIRGKMSIQGHETPITRFNVTGIHCLFKEMRVLHGDRLIEKIENYPDFVSWYNSLHNGGQWGGQMKAPGEFIDLGSYTEYAANSLIVQGGNDQIGLGDHQFAFQPLSALLGCRAVKNKFPLAVINPLEPLVLEFDITPDASTISLTTTVPADYKFVLKDCYLEADYDMMGGGLADELRSSNAGFEWDIPAYELHERLVSIPLETFVFDAGDSYGGEDITPVNIEFYVRSNVQAMTRMIHYFSNNVYRTTATAGPRQSHGWPGVTKWQYQIANQPVPDRAITSQVYLTTNAHYPRIHFGRMYTTSMKALGKLNLTPGCGRQPGTDFIEEYGTIISTSGTSNPGVVSYSSPFEWSALRERGEKGHFFLAYDFTRQTEGEDIGKVWGNGSFRLQGTEFLVKFGVFNRLNTAAFGGGGVPVSVQAYELNIQTLVEYKRRIIVDKLGRLDAYF